MKPYAYAVENDQGYIVGCWKDSSVAESVVAKGNPSHHERIVPLYDYHATELLSPRHLATAKALASIAALKAMTKE